MFQGQNDKNHGKKNPTHLTKETELELSLNLENPSKSCTFLFFI